MVSQILRNELCKLISKLRFSMSYITSEAQTLFGLVLCVLGWLVSLLGWQVGLFVCWWVGWLVGGPVVQTATSFEVDVLFRTKFRSGYLGVLVRKKRSRESFFLWVICIVHFVALPLHLSIELQMVKTPQKKTKQQQPPLRPNRQNHESMIPGEFWWQNHQMSFTILHCCFDPGGYTH